MSDISVSKEGAVATITLDRPAALNALSSGLCRELCDALGALDADDDVRALILTGAGDRAFSAGVDLKELEADPDALHAIMTNDAVTAITHCRKPVIGALNGVVVTGALEVAVACDILIASSAARFADTHVRVGLLPGWGLSQRLPRMIGVHRARQMSLTGNFIDAHTALAWGLVGEVVEPEELMPRVRQLAGDIASADPDCVTRMKALINSGFDAPLGSALAMERQVAWTYNLSGARGSEPGRRDAVIARGRAQDGSGSKYA